MKINQIAFMDCQQLILNQETIQLQEVMHKALKNSKICKGYDINSDIICLLMSVVAILLSLLWYSAAIDKFIAAKNMDSSVAELANKKIASYSKYLPTNEDAFFNGYKEGDTYTVGCWINESTKVRIK